MEASSTELKDAKDSLNETEKRKCDGKEPRKRFPKKQRLLKKCERPGHGEDRYEETDYYFENGLRKVYPYHYTFTTYCKGRWVNKKLIDVFSAEFLAQPLNEFETNIKEGQITVNGMKVDPEYILQDSDLIANVIHRHEVPVVDHPIKVLHVTDELVVIDKPSSIPVHPCGRYRNNTAVFILGKDFHYKDLRIAYRLDRLTSGLVMFSRTLQQDQKLKFEISNRQVEKQYLCRVEGVFPSYDSFSSKEPINCNEPIDVLSHRIGICKVGPNGKESQTQFERLSCNGKSSVVLCKPRTGRMHQIRVHLQYLGYPIMNDPLYNHRAFGPQKGKNGTILKNDDEVIRDLIKDNLELQWFIAESDAPTSLPGVDAIPSNSATNTPSSYLKVADQKESANNEVNSKHFDPKCGICLGRVAYTEPKPSQLIMYLHCWKYKGPDWAFETDIPEWAHEDWKEDNKKI